MRKIILMMSMSLDGYIAGPNHEIGWHHVDDELHQHINDVLKDMGAFLSGRVTYQLMADFWPTADRDPAAPAPVAEYARIWRNTPKVVFSKTLQHADWHTTIVRDIVAEDIRVLKEQEGGDLALSGAALAAEFLRLDLIDEFRIYVHPVLIGRGKPLFHEADAHTLTTLRLIDSHRFGNGVVLLHYEHAATVTR